MMQKEKNRQWRITNIRAEMVLNANSGRTVEDQFFRNKGWGQEEIDEARKLARSDIEKIRTDRIKTP